MASRHEKEERAEAAAWQAASDLRDVNRERECYEEREAKMATDQPQQERPGVIGSVLRSVADTLGHAKDAVVGMSFEAAEQTRETADAAEDKARENKDSVAEKAKGYKNCTTQKAKETTDSAACKIDETKESAKQKIGEYEDKAKEYKDYAAQKAKDTKDSVMGKVDEYKDYATEKAKETKNSALEKTGEYKDYAAEKSKETKDYTAEKAKEGKDVTVSKLGGLTESAKDAARKAVDFLSGKKEEVKEKAAETTEATKEKLSETEEAARRKTEGMKLRGEEHREEAAQKEAKDIEAERGTTTRETIFDSLGFGSIKDSIRGKLTTAEDIAEETRAARERGGTGRKCLNKDTGKEEMVIPIEENATGAVASILKASDQMSGQTFNDVGRMDDEGVIRVEMERTPKLSKDR